MDSKKIGKTIRSLRIEKHMTQKQLADEIGVSDKAVSKWECGTGVPDISMLTELSKHLEVDIERILKGDLTPNDFTGGNMKNVKYYVCPVCGNLSACTGDASITCCGRKLTALEPKKATEDEKLKIEIYGDELYIASDSPMTKEDYISFVAFAVGGGVEIIKGYPEWDFGIHLAKKKHGKLLWYSTTKGLFYQLV